MDFIIMVVSGKIGVTPELRRQLASDQQFNRIGRDNIVICLTELEGMSTEASQKLRNEIEEQVFRNYGAEDYLQYIHGFLVEQILSSLDRFAESLDSRNYVSELPLRILIRNVLGNNAQGAVVQGIVKSGKIDV